MKGSQGNKEKRKNYNQSKRPVNYVPKAHRNPDPAISNAVPAVENEEPIKTNTQPVAEASGTEAEKTIQPPDMKKTEKLSRSVLISLYSKKPVPAYILDSIKELKEIYSEEIILPVALTEFNLPLSKAIMPPRKTNPYEPKSANPTYRDSHKPEEEIGENDTGMVMPSDNSQQNPNEMPEWSTSSNTETGNTKEADAFSDDFRKMQISLEEEKAKYNKSIEKPRQKEPSTKVDIETIFKKLGDEGEYSNIDVKYEKSLKTTTKEGTENRIATELFGDPAIANLAEKPDSNSTANAIDITALEKQILKGSKQDDPDVNDEGEEKPVWDTFSAEEIKQQSQKNMENWGLTLIQDKDGLVKQKENNASLPIIQQPEQIYSKKQIYEELSPKIENKNPFCHSSLNIKETDRVWYYRDIQNCMQGPFTAIEMFVWHKAGYFPQDLPLKCGEYSPFISLADFLNSVKPKTRPEFMPMPVPIPVQRFDQSNMEAFFGGQFRPMEAHNIRGGPAPMTLEEIENQYREPTLEKMRSDPGPYSPQYAGYYGRPMPHYVGVPQYYQAYPAARQVYMPRNYVNEDPAIASARIGGTVENAAVHPDAGYITEEANDLKALLGMPGAEKHA